MRFTVFIYIIIAILALFSSCETNTGPSKNEPKQWLNSKLCDTITKLENLVDAVKSTDYQQAHAYSQLALSLAMRSNSEVALARAFQLEGVTYTNFHDDSSFYYFSNALRVANKYHIKEILPSLHYNLSMIYRSAFDNKMAVIYLDSSINYALASKNNVVLSNAYNTLGNVKYDLMDTLDAKRMYDSSYAVAKRNSLPKQMGVALASLSRFEKDPAVSEKLRKSAVETLRKKAGNEEEIAMILINLGTRSVNPDTAIRFFQSAIDYAKCRNANILEMAAYNNLAYSYLEKGDVSQAETCLVKYAIPLAQKTENYDWLSTLYDSYMDVLIADKKIAQALSFEQKALRMRVKADQKQASEQVMLLAALLDARNKELRIQAGEREIQEKETSIKQLVFWFSLAVLILVVVIFIVIMKMQRNRINYQARMITSAKKIIEMEEKQKGRVSMELHDLITPFYFTMLQHIEKAQIKDSGILGNLKASVSEMAKNIREISHRMNNDFIGQLNIKELVNGLCEDLNATTSIPINCDIGKEDFDLSKEETIHIYRIIQEILANAVKYCISGEINLNISIAEEMFILMYEDSGPGFDSHSKEIKGLGIMNIFERARIINGKAVLTTSPGKGTRWNVIIPIKKNKTDHVERANV